MRRVTLTTAALALAALALASCGDDGSDGGTGGVRVSASTTELTDIASNVAGERAGVAGILPPDADPHDYEPRPSDAESLLDADLILRSGGDLDLWLDDVIDSSGTDAPVVTMLDSVTTREQDGGVDPHWWQDPRNAIAATEVIRDRLSEVDPEGSDEYRRNAAAYIRRLEALDRRIAACIDRIPPDERRLVTTHDSLGYFADRYEIEVVGAVTGALTTQAQPSAGEVQELVDRIRELGVNAIFPEAGLNPDLESAIAEESGAAIGGELWADTLGPESSSGATYLDAMAHNADELAAGLSGGEARCSRGSAP